MSDTQPLAYLITNSADSLESYELSRLNRASNLRKEVFQVLEKWIDAEAQARMARSILDCRRVEVDNTNEPVTRLRGEPRAALTKGDEVEFGAEISLELAKKENGAMRCIDAPSATGIRPSLGTRGTRLRFGGIQREKRAASMLRLLEQCPRPLHEAQPSVARRSVSSPSIRSYRGETLNDTRVPGIVRTSRRLDCQRFAAEPGMELMLGAQRKSSATVD